MVVFPALSKPRISIRTSLEPKRLSKSRLIRMPMAAFLGGAESGRVGKKGIGVSARVAKK